MIDTSGISRLQAVIAIGLVASFGCGGSLPEAAPRDTGMLPAHWTDPDGRRMAVPFSFEAEDSRQGVLLTTLGKGGEHFRGPYVRVEESTKGELVTEVYDGWSGPEWEAWHHDADGQWTATAESFGDFAQFYTGKVVATLNGNENHSMRCRFTLTNPQGGWLDGGTGECQISDGARVDLAF